MEGPAPILSSAAGAWSGGLARILRAQSGRSALLNPWPNRCLPRPATLGPAGFAVISPAPRWSVLVVLAGAAGWAYVEMRGSLAQLDGEATMPGATGA
mgnify:CR=1 FL=1